MPFNPDIHHRQSIRLRDYDYSWAGAYFVTACVLQRKCLFGEIIDGKMILTETGRIVMATWSDIPNHYKNISLDESIIMPNHIHGIITIAEVNSGGNGRVANPPLRINATGKDLNSVEAGLKPAHVEKQYGLPEIIRGFKTFSSRRINVLRNNPGCSIWQRNYYERVIRNEQELTNAREYIVNNPLKWELDKENPINCRRWKV